MFEKFATEVYSLEAGNIIFIMGVGRIVVDRVEYSPVSDKFYVHASGVWPSAAYAFEREARVMVVDDVNYQTCYAEPGAGYGMG